MIETENLHTNYLLVNSYNRDFQKLQATKGKETRNKILAQENIKDSGL